jgi:hypothetical protein
MSQHQPKPERALFKIVLEGDVRKINAESNDAPTGGGARDIRFSHRLFEPVVVKMFPTPGVGTGTKRAGLPIQLGKLRYYDHVGQPQSKEIEYWPPTDSRDSEGRIARVPEIPPLAARFYPQNEGAVFYLLIQGSDGAITAHFASEASLRKPGVWNKDIANAILTSLAEAPGNVSARGWIDWTTGNSYIERRKPKKRGR